VHFGETRAEIKRGWEKGTTRAKRGKKGGLDRNGLEVEHGKQLRFVFILGARSIVKGKGHPTTTKRHDVRRRCMGTERRACLGSLPLNKSEVGAFSLPKVALR